MAPPASFPLEPGPGDALLVVDVQPDFLPGGALGVQGGDAVIAPLNAAIERFHRSGLPVIASRDWHPPDHCSFSDRGGPWPVHCVAGTPGAAFSDQLRLPPDTPVISKATDRDHEAYSAFSGTGLGPLLNALGVHRIFIGGLATDYCVLNTVRDARALGLEVGLLSDAICAVDPRAGEAAVQEMLALGAQAVHAQAPGETPNLQAPRASA